MGSERFNGLTRRSVKNRAHIEENLSNTFAVMEALDRLRVAHPEIFWATSPPSRFSGFSDALLAYRPAWDVVRGSVNIDFVPSDRGRLHRLSDKELEAVHQRVQSMRSITPSSCAMKT